MRNRNSFSYYTYEQDFSKDIVITKDTGLTWNVIIEDVNARKMVVYNIFQHGSFARALILNNKKYPDDNEFVEKTRRELMHYFWSKSEWEFVATDWPPHITIEELDRLNKEKVSETELYGREPLCLYVNPMIGEKIDVADQVLMNWQAFKQYLLINRKYIRKTLPKKLK